MIGRVFLAAVLWGLAAGTFAAEGRIQDLSPGQTVTGLRRLTVLDATASSVVGEPDGHYAAPRAIDGDRGTKWVASVAATPQAPQSITLELLGPQTVSALALFGEAPGNDGVRDAQVQTASSAGEFSTVATIRDAESGRWLVKFDPVKAAAVRLSVSRSGGVSTHTDVYEIELYGPPLSAAELREFAADRLRGCAQQSDRLIGAIQAQAPDGPQRSELKRVLEQFERHRESISERFVQWDTLAEPDRRVLAEQAEKLEVRAHRLGGWLASGGSGLSGRLEEIEKARQVAARFDAGDQVAATRDGRKLHVLNRRVLVTLDETTDTWDATWPGPVQAAVRGARFALDADDEQVALQAGSIDWERFSDRLGSGLQVRQQWAEPFRVERLVRVYDGRPTVVITGSVTNTTDRDLRLGSAKMLDVAAEHGGWWSLGRTFEPPSAVGYPGASPACRPALEDGLPAEVGESYGSTGVVAMAYREPNSALVLGFAAALGGSPSVHTAFRPGEGGKALSAVSRFGGRVVSPGKTVALDTVWLSVEADPLDALEHYGDAVAAMAPGPVRSGANSLWCSWYPIRMGISEEVVFANAAVAAKHFRPLGLDVIQLDHGWQRGDVCGDWVPNERFPHGLKWLAGGLQSRYGMKLGLWIAPTVVNHTSRLFAEHPDWLLRGADGKPAKTGRWFWVPNPDCYVLDASHPGAAQWLEETFRRLSAEGAGYYKIDFIAGSGGGFVQHDPQCTRGWGVLRRGIEAIRTGAGPDAWIRYCQTPPLLSVGLADSAYLGPDTGDAGGHVDLLRRNAPLLAASYWVNDRLYHREMCDMSVGMNAPIEEARLRLALMTLTGASISFSDDLRQLEPSRVRMMQQCLPPGNPAARPLDLFERKLPSLWHLHCKNAADEWDVVGLFNFEDRAQERTVELAAIGLPADAPALVYEFWEKRFLGIGRGSVTLKLPPQTSRILTIRRPAGRPQLVGTDMHVLSGYHELAGLAWDAAANTVSGRYRRAPGLSGNAFWHVPAGWRPRANVGAEGTAVSLERLESGVWVQHVEFESATADWSLAWERPAR